MKLNNCKLCDYDTFQKHERWCHMFHTEPREICKEYISSIEIVLNNLAPTQYPWKQRVDKLKAKTNS